MTINPNDHCPCGSGMKYKNCCGRQDPGTPQPSGGTNQIIINNASNNTSWTVDKTIDLKGLRRYPFERMSDFELDYDAICATLGIISGLSHCLSQEYKVRMKDGVQEYSIDKSGYDKIVKKAEKNFEKQSNKTHGMSSVDALRPKADIEIRFLHLEKESANTGSYLYSFEDFCKKYDFAYMKRTEQSERHAWTDPYDKSNYFNMIHSLHNLSGVANVRPDYFEQHFKELSDTFHRINQRREMAEITNDVVAFLNSKFNPMACEDSTLHLRCTESFFSIRTDEITGNAYYNTYQMENISSQVIADAITIAITNGIIQSTKDQSTGQYLWDIPSEYNCNKRRSLDKSVRLELSYKGKTAGKYKQW